MKHWLVMMVVVALSAPVASAALTLAREGGSDYSIIISATPPDSVAQAAAELQKDIQLATGATLPIVKDSDADNGKTPGKFISLGSTKQAKAAGISIDKIPDSGFHILTRGENLFILGPDTVAKVKLSRKGYGQMTPQPNIPGPQFTKDGGFSNGTANGVYTFLEDYLDVRWLMPGDMGRDVPTRTTFEIKEIDRGESPVFIYRNLILLEKNTSNNPQIHTWMNRQKLGFSFRLNSNHNWMKTVPASLYKEHPDWFAMIDGKRPKPGARYKLETTNPQLVQYFADQAVKAFKDDPHQNTFSLSPSDSRGYSESPASKALYDPPAPGSDHPSVTPLILKWYRDVSNAVAKMDPKAKLAGYFYQDYTFPPKKGGMTLPENFIPVLAPSFDYGYTLYRKDTQEKFETVMDGWAKVAPSIWFYYDLPNQLVPQYAVGMVTPPATEILNFVFPRLLKAHIKGSVFYGNVSWSFAALTNYIDARLLWDPKLDAAKLRDEWLGRAYGPRSGAVMRRFYDKLSAAFADFYRKYPARYHARERMFEHLFAPVYPQLEQFYLEALSQPMTAAQKQRLELIGNNLSVLQWRLRNAGYLPKDFAARDSPLKRTDQQVAQMLFPRKQTLPFDEFPVLWYQEQPTRTPVKVVLADKTDHAAKAGKNLNSGYILLYATKDQTVTIHPSGVQPLSSFLGYRVYEQAGEKYPIVAENLLYSGGTITFPAKAKTLYYLRITPQGIVPQGMEESSVRYTLEIPGASEASGSYSDKTLQLSGSKEALLVFLPPGMPLITRSGASGLTLITQGAADAERQGVMKRHPNLSLLQKLDEGWRFKIDPDGNGQKEGYASADFNDRSWDEISALDWWQNQGFDDYNGTAWYRKTFTVPQLNGGEQTLLFFGAVDGDAVIYLNGKKIGEHLPSKLGKGWDIAFSVGATKALKPGKNVVAVEVTKRQYMSGIYKGVALMASK